MNKKISILLILSLFLFTSSVFAEGVKMAQTFTLQAGWNAVYIEVTPDGTADEVFAAWPVERVGVYDPASYLETKQYSGSENTEGTRSSAYKMWRRGEPALSTLARVIANQIYVCNNTNETDYEVTLYGRPAAPRFTWHPSSTNETMNFVGISAVPGETNVTLDAYFNGFTGGPVNFYRFQGFNETIQLSPVSASDKFANGDVVVASAAKVSDFSGVLNVTPLTGLDFSTNLNYRTLSVRNDGATERTVSIKLDSGDIPTGGERPNSPEQLLVRESVGQTNEWVSFPAGNSFVKNLASGETLTLEIALDRTKLTTAAGYYYGGLLKIEDTSTGDTASHARVTLPIEVTSDGGDINTKAWPKGTWLASGSFDTVTYLKSTESVDAKAGGKMQVRLPLYVEYDGTMKLLQRFIHGVDSNGVTHVYSAAVENKFPVAIGNAKRVSSAVLPIEEPTIVSTNGTFGGTAEFGFTMGEDSKVNPYRHAFHPSHDGLRWDFETATPSGDDFNNYVSTVKPEIFSVTNLITFTWDESTGSQWTPDEKLSGDLMWSLSGVRHEGPITMKGRFTMKRISDADLDK